MNQDALHSFKSCISENKIVYTNCEYLDYDQMDTLKNLPFDVFMPNQQFQA